jgi:hypothetical protein
MSVPVLEFPFLREDEIMKTRWFAVYLSLVGVICFSGALGWAIANLPDDDGMPAPDMEAVSVDDWTPPVDPTSDCGVSPFNIAGEKR